MSKKVNETQKKKILNLFVKGKEIKDISKIFNFTISTITRQLKSLMGDEEFVKIRKNLKKKDSKNKIHNKIKKASISETKLISRRDNFQEDIKTNKENNDFNLSYEQEELTVDSLFVELAPIDYKVDDSKQKDLSSIALSEIDFPKVVFMIVDQKIELQTKLLKEYPEWQFLSQEDLNRKAIKIYFDLKSAKSDCNKDQKVIKVPNTNVFKIVTPILLSRGISRIVSSDQLIAL